MYAVALSLVPHDYSGHALYIHVYTCIHIYLGFGEDECLEQRDSFLALRLGQTSRQNSTEPHDCSAHVQYIILLYKYISH